MNIVRTSMKSFVTSNISVLMSVSVVTGEKQLVNVLVESQALIEIAMILLIKSVALSTGVMLLKSALLMRLSAVLQVVRNM